MTVIHLPGPRDVRVAYSVGRKVGPAVVRNKVRRRLRAAVRDLDVSTGGLATGIYLVIVRPEAARCTYAELHRNLGLAVSAASTVSSTSGGPAGPGRSAGTGGPDR
jgi:ribonuclease P protein component